MPDDLNCEIHNGCYYKKIVPEWGKGAKGHQGRVLVWRHSNNLQGS